MSPFHKSPPVEQDFGPPFSRQGGEVRVNICLPTPLEFGVTGAFFTLDVEYESDPAVLILGKGWLLFPVQPSFDLLQIARFLEAIQPVVHCAFGDLVLLGDLAGLCRSKFVG